MFTFNLNSNLSFCFSSFIEGLLVSKELALFLDSKQDICLFNSLIFCHKTKEITLL